MVALGGGHGLFASLSALRRVTRDLTAVVTVADDGGSSRPAAPASSACCRPATCGWRWPRCAATTPGARTWSRVLQHRFTGDGELGGHAVGNVLIVALWELLGDPVEGLDWVARLLGAHGRVLPMASVPLDIVAEVQGADPGTRTRSAPVRGQVAVATTPGRVRSVSLIPADPPACPEAVQAIAAADWVVLGPGSWFTSVLPHLLVPELAAALPAPGHGGSSR